jgi:hypothetical protein
MNFCSNKFNEQPVDGEIPTTGCFLFYSIRFFMRVNMKKKGL